MRIRMHKRFVAGTVVTVLDGVTDCLHGVSVALHRDGTMVARAINDGFGDFKSDGLPDEPLACERSVERPGQHGRRAPIRTDVAGTSVGVVSMSPCIGAAVAP